MAVPGLLLTGGASSRMGVAKATLVIDGETLVDRAARVLSEVCRPVAEIGPGYSALETVVEEDPHQGPLAALVAGADALALRGPVLLLACDLPFVSAQLLARLVEWPGAGTVVPVDRDGMVQPVCARYSQDALDRARSLVAEGERSLRSLLRGAGVTLLDDADPRELVDVDTPDDASRWGIEHPGNLES